MTCPTNIRFRSSWIYFVVFINFTMLDSSSNQILMSFVWPNNLCLVFRFLLNFISLFEYNGIDGSVYEWLLMIQRLFSWFFVVWICWSKFKRICWKDAKGKHPLWFTKGQYEMGFKWPRVVITKIPLKELSQHPFAVEPNVVKHH